MKDEIGSYEAKTRLPELLRQVAAGKSFTITNRGRAVADLVPHEDQGIADRRAAVRRLQDFISAGKRKKNVNIDAHIREGRD